MNIAVIAANGRTGRAFVKAALAAGHAVNAGSLTPGSLPSHPRLKQVRCDATNENDLACLLENQDAVASFIGHVKGSTASVQTEAMRTLITVMHNQGVKRVVSLTGTGVRFKGDHITLADRILNIGIGLIDPARVHDGKTHAEALKSSDLDWTILRVLKLQNTKKRPFSLREHGPTKLYVSRAEVAEAALQVIEAETFIRQAPIISKVR